VDCRPHGIDAKREYGRHRHYKSNVGGLAAELPFLGATLAKTGHMKKIGSAKSLFTVETLLAARRADVMASFPTLTRHKAISELT
jgi:hypothetical protein